MKVIPLYKFIRPDGGVTVSPVKPEVEYSEMFRLVADEGMILKNGDVETTCTDVISANGWEEIEAPEEDTEKVFE